MHAPFLDGIGDHVLAKIGVQWITQAVHQHILVEEVDAHARQVFTPLGGNAIPFDSGSRSTMGIEQIIRLGLLDKRGHATIVCQFHDA